MKDMFFAYYRLDETALKQLWAEGLIVLDANVLLNLYRYPTAAREDLLSLLKELAERIAIPHQAALEYQVNRLGVIAAQKRRFDEVRKVLSDVQGQLVGEMGKLQLKKRHSIISAETLLAEVEGSIEKFRQELKVFEKEQLDVFDEDPIRKSLDEILKGRIGPAPSQTELDAIYLDGKKRFELLLPPGFKDEAKGKDAPTCHYSNGLRIERKFGDLIVWEQTLKLARARECSYLIFVTDDEKGDWWQTVDSMGSKTIGARTELVEEARTKAGIASFAMYNSERFMQFAREYLGLTVSQSSIDQIEEIREDLKDGGPTRFAEKVEASVYNWLQSAIHPDEIITRSEGFPDFIVNGTIAYEVKILSKKVLQQLRDEYFAQHQLIPEIRRMYYVLVARSVDNIDSATKSIEERLANIPSNASIILGYLDFAGSAPVFRPYYVANGESGPVSGPVEWP